MTEGEAALLDWVLGPFDGIEIEPGLYAFKTTNQNGLVQYCVETEERLIWSALDLYYSDEAIEDFIKAYSLRKNADMVGA